MLDLKTNDDWKNVLTQDRVVVYKHSPICGLSARALPQVRGFEKLSPDIPVYKVNVILRRKLAGRIAEELGVRHESPQVIVLKEGEPNWHASHFDVTTEGILAAISSS